MFANGPEWLGEDVLAPVEFFSALALECLGNVGGGDGTKEAAFFAI